MNQIGMILEQYEASGMSVALCLNEQIACTKQVQQRGIYALGEKNKTKKKTILLLLFKGFLQASVKEHSIFIH